MVTTSLGGSAGPRPRPARGSFYLILALIMAGIVTYGFSLTVGDGLIHPKIARPPILYLHAALFSTWLVLFVTQTALVRTGSLGPHRRLGLAGLCVGAAMPFVGVATAIVMRRFEIVHFHQHLGFIAIPLGDMAVFTPCFVLGAAWRKRPEYHRRLMFLASVTLIGAGLGRFPVPDAWFDFAWFYFVVDGLVLAAMARDLIVLRRIHPVYAAGLPLFVIAQAITFVLWRWPPTPWLGFLRWVVGAG